MTPRPASLPTAEIFDAPGFHRVYRLRAGDTVAFVAIHRLVADRCFGGIRVRSYASEAAARADVERLALGMSHKLQLTGLGGGGAKTVVMARPEWTPEQRAQALADVGRFVQSLGGTYGCGGDLGFTDRDHEVVAQYTQYIAPTDLGLWTARSVEISLLTAGEVLARRITRVTVQGLGAVGGELARRLRARGVEIIAAEIKQDGAPYPRVDPAAIFAEPADAFAPCAGGQVITSQTADVLAAPIVCGGANQPLAVPELAQRLHDRGVWYVPDVLANAGATIRGVSLVLGEEARVDERFDALADTVRRLLLDSVKLGQPPATLLERWLTAA